MLGVICISILFLLGLCFGHVRCRLSIMNRRNYKQCCLQFIPNTQIIQIITVHMEHIKQQFLTVQDYISTLFDNIPKVSFNKSDSASLLQSCLEQNKIYGRKIIELSEKFTAKYRKDHFVESKLVEKKIMQIYHLLYGDTEMESLQNMLDAILMKAKGNQQQIGLKQNRLNDKKQSLAASEVTQKIQESQIKKKSLNKSKISKKDENFTTKKVLQVKSLFEQQQQAVRQVYSSLRMLCEHYKISFSQQKLKYIKNDLDQQPENMIELIKINLGTQSLNLKKVKTAVESIDEIIGKKVLYEGVAQGRLHSYIEQIQRREDVYSYAVSKMLQNVTSLKTLISTEQLDDCLKLIENLESIGQKFYELYPTHKTIKNLHIQPKFPDNKRHQGVQVTLIKGQKSVKQTNEFKRNQLEVYKLITKISQFIQKFERMNKHRKNFQSKQIDKLLEGVRQCLPKKSSNNLSSQQVSFQQQIRKIMEANERVEKQLSQQYNNKLKKNEKRMQQLQKLLQETMHELQKLNEQRENDKKKFQKKLEQEKAEHKKILNQKEHVEKNLDDLIDETNRLRVSIRNEKQHLESDQQQISRENKELHKLLEQRNNQLIKIQSLLEEEKLGIAQQRKIYKQKIVILQAKQQEKNLQLAECNQQRTQILKDNSILKKQIEELTELYEEKIKEFQQMIDDIKQFQIELSTKNTKIKQLQELLVIKEKESVCLEEELEQIIQHRQCLKKELEHTKIELNKFKQIGVLNEEDIEVLKQEMEKVKNAYIESEQQLQNMKILCLDLQKEKNRINKQKNALNNVIQDLENHMKNQRAIRQQVEHQSLQSRDQLILKSRQLKQTLKHLDDLKRENSKLRNQVSQLREESLKNQKQIRQNRQQITRKKQQQSLEGSKKKLEVQALKVQLRRKTQQFDKQKQQYQQQIEVLTQKNQQLQQLITQKQLLMKLANNHSTN